MKRITKIFAVALVLILAALSFAACGSSSGGGSSKSKSKGYSTAEACAEAFAQCRYKGDYDQMYKMFPSEYTRKHMEDKGYSNTDLSSAMREASEDWKDRLEQYEVTIKNSEASNTTDFDDYDLEYVNESYDINATEAKTVKVKTYYTMDGDEDYETDSIDVVKIGEKWYVSPEEFYYEFYYYVDDYLPQSENSNPYAPPQEEEPGYGGY